jgi:ABC-type phosphate transport system substrate-binding protein
MENLIKMILPFVFIALLTSFKPIETQSANEEIILITNPSISESKITLQEVNGYFTGEKVRWKHGQKIQIAIMKSSTHAGEIIARNILGVSARDMDKFYLKQVFQGKMTAPKMFGSEIELAEYVAETPGCIGIISSKTSTQNVNRIVIK